MKRKLLYLTVCGLMYMLVAEDLTVSTEDYEDLFKIKLSCRQAYNCIAF